MLKLLKEITKMEIKPNNIYLGDAYELIKQLPDKSVDLVITDPPYEIVGGGSGSVMVAAKRLNRKYIGFEIEEKWYKVAKDRLQGIDQNGNMNLFDIPTD